MPDHVTERRTDRFGNTIDPMVGYARGRILASPIDDVRRLARAWSLTRERVATHGRDPLAIFTGMSGDLGIESADVHLCNEWTGSPLVDQELRHAALAHLGGSDVDGFCMLARTSAAMITWLALKAWDAGVISVVPRGGRSHPSVRMGAALARSRLVEIPVDQLTEHTYAATGATCVVVTAVTSSLERLSDDELRAVVDLAHRRHAVVLVDDAYGARLRPVLFGGSPSLSFGADVVVTNSDKAGLRGPRAALVAGRADLVLEMATWAAERGMDARAPVMAGALRALLSFDPDDLRREASDAQRLGRSLAADLGADMVAQGILGPTVTEEDAVRLLDRCGAARVHEHLVPCEATAAIGMVLLRRFGIVTVNTHAQPGARVSLRLKPVLGHLALAGGADAVTAKVRDAVAEVVTIADQPAAMRRLLIGDTA
jgi:L-seryl-tRNA(Ser) seleniumtransferase